MLVRLLVVGLVTAVLQLGVAKAQFTDVSSEAGADVGGVKDGGASFGDLDSDGWLDLFVNTNSESYVLMSDGGSPPTFTVRTTMALSDQGLERAAVIADLNNDGHPDLVRSDNDDLHVLLNSGPPDYTFEDIDLAIDETSDPGINVEGVAAIDWDGDGWLELFMENTGPQLYENPEDGTADFTRLDPMMTGLPDGRAMSVNADYVAVVDFDVDGNIDAALRSGGTALPTLFANEGGVFTGLAEPSLDSNLKGGIRFCDFDADGRFDMFFTGGSGGGRNRILLQTAPRSFTEAATPMPGGSVIDAACADVDNDGDQDLYLARRGSDEIFLNRLTQTGTATFEAADLGVATSLYSECPSFADYDNDGDLDLYVNRTGEVTTDTMVDPPVTTRDPARNVLYRNDTDGNDYLMVEVLTAAGACPSPTLRSDIGAVASLSSPMGFDSGVREINGGQGHGNQGSGRMHFGLPLGPDIPYELTVHFAADAYPDVTIAVTPSSLGDYQLLTVDATDIDGDGILTTQEVADAGATVDADGDGLPAWNDPDANGNGIPDAVEAGDDDLCTPPVDTDGDGTPDYLELTAPGDGGTDASLPDGSTIDSGSADTGGDGSGSVQEAHGSGCVQCTAGRDDGRGGAFAFSLLLLSVLVARRRR